MPSTTSALPPVRVAAPTCGPSEQRAGGESSIRPTRLRSFHVILFVPPAARPRPLRHLSGTARAGAHHLHQLSSRVWARRFAILSRHRRSARKWWPIDTTGWRLTAHPASRRHTFLPSPLAGRYPPPPRSERRTSRGPRGWCSKLLSSCRVASLPSVYDPCRGGESRLSCVMINLCDAASQ